LKIKRTWTLFAPLGGCVLLAGWIALSAANIPAAGFSLLIYGLANLIVFTDAFDFVLRLYVRRRHVAVSRVVSGVASRVRSGAAFAVTAGETTDATDASRDLSIDLAATLPAGVRRVLPIRPYAIIASIFNLESELEEFMEAFASYRDRVWLMSDGSTDNTVMRLRQAGWRCFEDGINRRKPAALRRLLERLPPHIETVMVIDPDIRIRGRGAGSAVDLERVIGDFQQSGAAAACPRIMIEPDGFLARFQAFEYALAFRIGRVSLADYSVTSGVSFYRREALARALSRHSLSVYAEDLENAVILLSEGERIYYDGRLVVSTEGPGLWRRWFSQRVGWYYGLIKVYTERFAEIRRIGRRAPFARYHFIVYMGMLSLAFHVLKVVSATLLLVSFISGFDNLLVANWLPSWVRQGTLTNPAYFAAAVGSYFALGITAFFTAVPKAERAYTAPIVPVYLFYALVHVVPMTVGFANWIAFKWWGRRLYQDHYENHQEAGHEPGPGTHHKGDYEMGPVMGESGRLQAGRIG
jgi:cellulose synthase/poly-beta-1,6-N-acetylglucosamine synthase-like glycosyltransferase